nr:MAG TPA: hypothetical protein [Crassvirales sp.]
MLVSLKLNHKPKINNRGFHNRTSTFIDDIYIHHCVFFDLTYLL